MKKRRSFLASLLILLGTLSQPMSEATTVKANRSAVASNNAPLPDLIVTWSLPPDPKKGKFQIRIKNVGTATAAESYVILKLTHYSSKGDVKPKEMSYHAKIPGVGIGQEAAVVIETKLDVVWDKQCVIADGTNQIVESNEDNNKWCGLCAGTF